MENEVINKLRQGIDKLDDQIAELFVRRLKLIDGVGREKARLQLDISAVEREQSIINRVTIIADKDFEPYMASLFDSIFHICKLYEVAIRTGADFKKK